MQKERSNFQSFRIDFIEIRDRDTVFKLDHAKNGFNKIVFQRDERADIKGLMLSFFQSGTAFSFDPDRSLGNGECTLKRLVAVAD